MENKSIVITLVVFFIFQAVVVLGVSYLEKQCKQQYTQSTKTVEEINKICK